MKHMVGHELLDLLFPFSSLGVAEQLSKIDGVAGDCIFIDVDQF